MGLKERREREKQQRKKQILDAARALLFEKGLNGTSMNQIAQLAELSVGTIYFYYKSKEEIFAVLQQEGLELLYNNIEKIYRSKSDNKTKLKKISLEYLKFSRDYKDYFDIINYFLSSPEVIFDPELKSQIDQHGIRILAIVTDIINSGINEGIFPKGNARRYSIILWGTIHGLLQFRKLESTILEGENFEELFESTVDFLLKV